MARSRITVTNFDALAQSQLWLEVGAEEAIEQLVAMLRAAVLMGVELVVDRNQVLDGVFFLAMGPDRLARQLGLEPGARLPITMNCSPALMDEEADARLVPSHRGRIPDPVQVSLGRQLHDVATARFLTASSSLAAVSGALPDTSWLAPTPGPEWYPGCGFVDELHPLPVGDVDAALAVIRARQLVWVEAAETGRIAVDTWGGQMRMEPALANQRQRLAEATAPDLVPNPLAEHVLGITSTVRKDAIAGINAWAAEHQTPDQHKRLALALWSRAYYLAIAGKDSCMLISFDQPTETGEPIAGSDTRQVRDPELLPLERSFGLATAPSQQGFRRPRWLSRAAAPANRPLRVEGEILDHLRIMDPGTFRQLSRSTRDVVHAWVQDRDPSEMYNIALACRRAVDHGPSHRRVAWVTTLRVVTMTLLALVIAGLTVLPEFFSLTRGQQVTGVVLAAALGVLASLPWDDIVEQYGLRRGAMVATLNLKELEH